MLTECLLVEVRSDSATCCVSPTIWEARRFAPLTDRDKCNKL